MLQKFFHLGVREGIDDYLRGKVIMTNQLVFILAIVDTVYFLGSLFFFPQLVFIYIFGGGLLLFLILLNIAGQYNASRLLASLSPMFIGGFSYLAISQGSADILLGNAFIIFGFLLVPFIIFDFRERRLLFLSALIVTIPFLFQDPLNVLVDIKVDNSVFKLPIVDFFTHCLAIIIFFAFLYMLLKVNWNAEQRYQRAMAEAEQKAQALQASRQVMETTLAEVERARAMQEQRAWINDGIAQLAALLQAGQSDHLTDHLISALVRYVGANQGGLYEVKSANDQTRISLSACYAYGRKKFNEQELAPGEGLLGQVYLEKEKMIFTKVPQGYLTITSGLGEASPSCLVIIPLIANGQVEGLIELASFHRFEDHHIEFLEKAADNLAGWLATDRANARTLQLLEQTRLQAEAMRAQEETMRQTLKELMMGQEQSYRNQG